MEVTPTVWVPLRTGTEALLGREGGTETVVAIEVPAESLTANLTISSGVNFGGFAYLSLTGLHLPGKR